MRELAHILRGCGFKVESQRYIGLPSSYRLRKRNIAGRVVVHSLIALESVFPSFRHHILIEATKHPTDAHSG